MVRRRPCHRASTAHRHHEGRSGGGEALGGPDVMATACCEAYVPSGLPSDGAIAGRGCDRWPHVTAGWTEPLVSSRFLGHHRHRPPILTDLRGSIHRPARCPTPPRLFTIVCDSQYSAGCLPARRTSAGTAPWLRSCWRAPDPADPDTGYRFLSHWQPPIDVDANTLYPAVAPSGEAGLAGQRLEHRRHASTQVLRDHGGGS